MEKAAAVAQAHPARGRPPPAHFIQCTIPEVNAHPILPTGAQTDDLQALRDPLEARRPDCMKATPELFHPFLGDGAVDPIPWGG